MVIALVIAALVFPDASFCVADKVLLPLSFKSASTIAIVHFPSESTVVVLSATPVSNPETVTVAPTSPVPVKLNPAAFSAALIKSSVDTVLITTAAGAIVSVTAELVATEVTVSGVPCASV